jgi:Putative DNA-binding domain
MALALREWQATFAAQLAAGGGAARMAIHRHHIASSLAKSLGVTFSTVQALVGEEFFAQFAQAFVARELPTQPVLAEYGAGFADLIAAHASAQGLPYLADVARLDWALNVAFHSPRGPRLSAGDLSALPAGELAACVLPLAPGTALLRSDYPLDLIWAASQPGASQETVALDRGASRLLVLRQAADAAFVVLDEGEAAFVAALATGLPLQEAAEMAFGSDPAFDLGRRFARLLGCEVFAAMQH